MEDNSDNADQGKTEKEILSEGKWVHGNFSNSDEHMRARFRARYGEDPKYILREHWWCYAGPIPESDAAKEGKNSQM